MRTISTIVVHHSATKDGPTVSWGAIEDFHKTVRGWRDIGYHAGVEQISGRSHALYGRPLWLPGAHVEGANANTLGLCIIGNYNEAEPPEALVYLAINRVIVPWLVEFSLLPTNVRGHREVTPAPTDCPGSLFDMDKFRAIIAAEYDRVKIEKGASWL